MVNVSAISPNSLPRLPGVTAAEYRQQQHQHTESRHDQEGRRAKPAHRESGNAGNGLPQTLSVFFFFWGRGVETRCSCCRPPTLCSDKVSRNQRQRSGNRLRRTKAAHRGKPATADNRPPAKLTGAKDQRKPCGAPFANVVETGGAGRCTGIATPEPTSNSGRRCVGQFGGRGSAPAARERLQRRTALPGRSASGARTGAGGGDL
jgi:hypothetical protein